MCGILMTQKGNSECVYSMMLSVLDLYLILCFSQIDTCFDSITVDNSQHASLVDAFFSHSLVYDLSENWDLQCRYMNYWPCSLVTLVISN